MSLQAIEKYYISGSLGAHLISAHPPDPVFRLERNITCDEILQSVTGLLTLA